MKTGDLTWLPSNITLVQMDEKDVVTSWLTVKQPTNAVLLEKGEVYHQILYEGQRWLARRCDLYGGETC